MHKMWRPFRDKTVGDRMIISEKQIIQLISIANELKQILTQLGQQSMLKKSGDILMNDTCTLLNNITNQQSEELKEVK